MISVRNLSKNYGKVNAVKGVSFEVGRGEIVGLLGHNGAGKTTVMKIITGFLEPTEGHVSVGNFDVLKDRLAVQHQIGYMPESAPLYNEMLVQEYLLMMAELRGIELVERERAVIEAVKSTGLVEFLVRPISTLSKGYRQRVGLAQAILHKPDVLILDEPTNGLDPVQIVEIRKLIKKLARNSTVFLSTHILSEIEAVCDRVVVLIDGELAKDAPLKEMIASKRVRFAVAENVAGVPEALGKIDGIKSTVSVGADPILPGFTRYSVEYQGDSPPVAAILACGREHNWDIGSVAPETMSLEQVFRTLMEEHVLRKQTRRGKEVAA